MTKKELIERIIAVGEQQLAEAAQEAAMEQLAAEEAKAQKRAEAHKVLVGLLAQELPPELVELVSVEWDSSYHKPRKLTLKVPGCAWVKLAPDWGAYPEHLRGVRLMRREKDEPVFAHLFRVPTNWQPLWDGYGEMEGFGYEFGGLSDSYASVFEALAVARRLYKKWQPERAAWLAERLADEAEAEEHEVAGPALHPVDDLTDWSQAAVAHEFMAAQDRDDALAAAAKIRTGQAYAEELARIAKALEVLANVAMDHAPLYLEAWQGIDQELEQLGGWAHAISEALGALQP